MHCGQLGILELNRIYQMDCLEGMKLIPDKSIDMILCDLPYGTTRLKWDSVLNLEKLWEEYTRIIKDNGAIVLSANQPFTSKLVSSNYEMFKYGWIWVKPYVTGFLNAHYRPMLCYEDILVFSKSGAGAGSKNKGNMKYFPQGLELINEKKINHETTGGKVVRNTQNVGENNVLNSGKEYMQKYKGYPRNLLEYDIDRPTLHPTQKPVLLFEYLIKTYSNESDIILDNCMGSGTTAIAALNTMRKFIGFEIDQKYIEISNMRIKEKYDSEMTLIF